MTLDIAGAGAQDTQAIPAPTSISSEEIGNKFIVSVCDNIEVRCKRKQLRRARFVSARLSLGEDLIINIS